MLDPEEIGQVTNRILDLMGTARQHNGSYRYLVDLNGVVMFSHHRIGHVLRDFG